MASFSGSWAASVLAKLQTNKMYEIHVYTTIVNKIVKLYIWEDSLDFELKLQNDI